MIRQAEQANKQVDKRTNEQADEQTNEQACDGSLKVKKFFINIKF